MQAAPRKKTKANQVLDQLRLDIINGYFAPGEKLAMELLKERYGVGYSPLREALSCLVGSGLIHAEEQCGFSVAPLSLNELYDLYSVRIHIETLALELSIQNGQDDWEADIIACWHRYSKYLSSKDKKDFDPSKWDILQKEFRLTLIKACNSPWLLKIREQLQEQSLRYRSVCMNTYYKDKKMLDAFIKENTRLVSAVLTRDTEKAIQISKKSWETSIKIIADALKK